jgi:amidase
MTMKLSSGLYAVLSLASWLVYAQSTSPVEGESVFFPSLDHVNSTELFPMNRCGTFHLHEATIDQMQQAMKNGTLTSTQLVGCYLERAMQTQEYVK